jgi:hypothetical protein
MPASAQTASTAPVGTPNQPCFVFTVAGPAGRASELGASCNGRGLLLGDVSNYQVIADPTLNAIVVDKHLGGERRLILITIRTDGRPLVEDITGDLAVAAGRGVMSNLVGLDVNLGSFASNGTIAVSPAARDQTSGDRSGQVNLRQQVAAENARQAEAVTQN